MAPRLPLVVVLSSVRTLEAALRLYFYGLSLIVRGLEREDEHSQGRTADAPLSEAELASQLSSLGINFIIFTGSPLNRLSGGVVDRACDAPECGKNSWLWAECETCNSCYCFPCYNNGTRCCPRYVH